MNVFPAMKYYYANLPHKFGIFFQRVFATKKIRYLFFNEWTLFVIQQWKKYRGHPTRELYANLLEKFVFVPKLPRGQVNHKILKTQNTTKLV